MLLQRLRNASAIHSSHSSGQSVLANLNMSKYHLKIAHSEPIRHQILFRKISVSVKQSDREPDDDKMPYFYADDVEEVEIPEEGDTSISNDHLKI